jgi:hypothetical protein
MEPGQLFLMAQFGDEEAIQTQVPNAEFLEFMHRQQQQPASAKLKRPAAANMKKKASCITSHTS